MEAKTHRSAKLTRHDIDQSTLEIYDKVRPYTMTSLERVVALSDAIRYLIDNGIDGAIVECGVWKGGSMMAAALTLLDMHKTDRDLFLFDTFEGMTPPSERDRTLRGESAHELMAGSDRQSSWIWARSPLHEVKEAMTSTGYPSTRVRFVQGRVEDSLPRSAPETIALLRLDTDWYESTRWELEFLYPQLVRGGVLIVDDYGHWEGARRAVDEYIREHGHRLLLNRVDYTGRIAVKID